MKRIMVTDSVPGYIKLECIVIQFLYASSMFVLNWMDLEAALWRLSGLVLFLCAVSLWMVAFSMAETFVMLKSARSIPERVLKVILILVEFQDLPSGIMVYFSLHRYSLGITIVKCSMSS